MDQAWEKAWPFWKFGLKYDDLNTTLQDKYNTTSSAIQDPDAFHHDVYELSSRANTLDEFEQLMEERKMLRLKELNSMLEDASFEIVGNPNLIGSDQWAVAVQLFRTRSLDSLVRYFASYLPTDHPWHHDSESPVDSSGSDATSPIDYDSPTLFDEPEEDDILYTNPHSECCSMTDMDTSQPTRSMTMRSEDSGVSVSERNQMGHKLDIHSRSPARAMSISDSEPDHMVVNLQDSIPTLDDTASSSDDPETPSTSISDISEADDERFGGKDMLLNTIGDEESIDGYHLSISHTELQPMDSMDSETPTPKAEYARSPATPATSFFEAKPSPLRPRSLSPNRSHPHHAHPTCTHQDYRKHHATSRQLRQREGSLDRERPARSSGGRSSRGREVTPDGARSRARARRRRVLV